MIKNFIVILTFFAASTLFSQSDHDQRLLERYSESELSELKTNNPQEYKVLVNALDKGIFIGPIPTEKGKDLQFDGELDIDPSKEHNFITIGVELKENHYQYYRIKGTDKMVGVLPKSLLK